MGTSREGRSPPLAGKSLLGSRGAEEVGSLFLLGIGGVSRFRSGLQFVVNLHQKLAGFFRVAFHVVAVVFLRTGDGPVGFDNMFLSLCQVRMELGVNVLNGFLRETDSAEQYSCQQRGIDESFPFHGSLLVWNVQLNAKSLPSAKLIPV